MICNASIEDIDSLLKITAACALHMTGNGIYQWNEYYPNRFAFENDVKRDELYVYKNTNEIIGCIAISTLMDEEYKTIQWLTENHENIYIHRLAVHPEHQGKGVARKLMDFAEKKSRTEKKVSIRLDTFSKNLRNQKFYEHRGYQRLGSIYFPKQSEFPFYCYELVL